MTTPAAEVERPPAKPPATQPEPAGETTSAPAPSSSITSPTSAGVIVPGRHAIYALAALSLFFLGGAVEPVLLWAGLLGNVGVVLLVAMEGAFLRRQAVTVSREWPRRVQIDRPAELHFTIANRGRRRLKVALRQPWPADLQAEGGRVETVVDPGEQVTMGLTVRPRRRGRVAMPPLEVDVRFVAGLAARRSHVSEPREMTVFPDLQGLADYEKLRRSRALRQAGFHRQRILGAGREFDQMREYLPGDDYRDVNWSATARMQEPITNLHQAERSRDVLLCVDCGRMMGNPVGSGTALDRAVDAALMLTHVSRSQGDRVGLMLFRDVVEATVKPAADAATSTAIVERLVAAQPSPAFPSFAALVERLRQRQNHRSLVFIFTDLNDPQLAQDLTELMPMLARRHLVVVVSLRDALVDRIAEGGAADRREVYEVLAARQLVQERDEHRRNLVKAGVQVLEADADRLSLDVINRYMAIKSRQML